MYANEAYVMQALSNGAYGYVLKDASIDELVRAIHEAIAGRRYLSPPLSEFAIEAYVNKAQAAHVDSLRGIDDARARDTAIGRRRSDKYGHRRSALDQPTNCRSASCQPYAQTQFT
jgi:ActR/RegA family two-component response regulator